MFSPHPAGEGLVRPIVVWEEGNEVLPSQGGFGIIGLRSPKISARTSGIRTERSPTSGSWRKARATLIISRRIARIRFLASVWAWIKCLPRPRYGNASTKPPHEKTIPWSAGAPSFMKVA